MLYRVTILNGQHYCFTPKDMKNRIPIKVFDFSETIFVFSNRFRSFFAIFSKNKISSERVNKTNEFH